MQSEWHTSPDGRIIVRYEREGDPRSAAEVDEIVGVNVRDAATGAILGVFEASAEHRFPEEGGVEIRFRRTLIHITPDLAAFRAHEDGTHLDHVEEMLHPIETLDAWLRADAARHRPAPRDPEPLPAPPLWAGIPGCLLLSIVPLAILFSLPPVRDLIQPLLPASLGGGQVEQAPLPAALPGEVTAWAVTCPGIGPVLFRLDATGRLAVPPRIAAAPLTPQEGFSEPGTRRFGDGRVVVEVRSPGRDGLAGARWWPQGTGEPAVACEGGMRPSQR